MNTTTASNALNPEVQSHLVKLLTKLIAEKPENALKQFESLSIQLKQQLQQNNNNTFLFIKSILDPSNHTKINLYIDVKQIIT